MVLFFLFFKVPTLKLQNKHKNTRKNTTILLPVIVIYLFLVSSVSWKNANFSDDVEKLVLLSFRYFFYLLSYAISFRGSKVCSMTYCREVDRTLQYPVSLNITCRYFTAFLNRYFSVRNSFLRIWTSVDWWTRD